MYALCFDLQETQHIVTTQRTMLNNPNFFISVYGKIDVAKI
ncbi:hypothetical protein TFKS16_0664 [Tannerella forsythia KS16]|uniref:Uncharacterized protein n=1 Tax=Tannerella forsythia (strain ATCC 43037 / JCM 10827 / CCUG 21028 A / KCTC 5666 / FDC 338) TaxID=203275 RepID=G8UMZ8_TANFA|nr:hypothetical protein BFO_0720 [Tannerella forsythia 92A2]BAR48262.1 hypothetical protein TF3313_0696 [Tannerella forsythia 3313]BAR50962.1 hypothetical protein TFKS16_0664 [Tannerella forsythia KS16]